MTRDREASHRENDTQHKQHDDNEQKVSAQRVELFVQARRRSFQLRQDALQTSAQIEEESMHAEMQEIESLRASALAELSFSVSLRAEAYANAAECAMGQIALAHALGGCVWARRIFWASTGVAASFRQERAQGETSHDLR